MNIPSKIKILGHIYEVILRDRETEDGGERNPGTCDNKFCRIWIDNTWAESQQEETLLHEICEAINFILDLELDHKQLTSIAASFYQVFKDNQFKI